MQLILDHVVPKYIEPKDNSEIWRQRVQVNRGEHLHVVAPSGSGKSTLIHFIYGLRNDYQGEILLDGQPVTKLPAEKIAVLRQKHLSIIFQDLRLFPRQTVLENIELKRQLAPFHPPEAIQMMADRLGIGNKLEQMAQTCSYGEQQRVAIIRALMQPFGFLLLDEPFSHLDETNRTKAMELIREECDKRGAAMIFADLGSLEFFKNEKNLRL